MALNSLCVFCGSSDGSRPEYAAAAEAMGVALAGAGIQLVYGGAHVGLMGRIADAALGAGGRVVGVMPTVLVEKEVAHRGLSELHEVASMHERKALMADLSDGFVSLPGGAGTLEEAFEVWTWAQLGIHAKPVAFLNTGGYFNTLIALVDHMVEEKFLRRQHADMLIVKPGVDELIEACRTYVPRHVTKWVTAEGR